MSEASDQRFRRVLAECKRLGEARQVEPGESPPSPHGLALLLEDVANLASEALGDFPEPSTVSEWQTIGFHYERGNTKGSLAVKVWNGPGLWLHGEQLTTEEFVSFIDRHFYRGREAKPDADKPSPSPVSKRYLGNKRGTIRGRGKGPRDSEALADALGAPSPGLSALTENQIADLLVDTYEDVPDIQVRAHDIADTVLAAFQLSPLGTAAGLPSEQSVDEAEVAADAPSGGLSALTDSELEAVIQLMTEPTPAINRVRDRVTARRKLGAELSRRRGAG